MRALWERLNQQRWAKNNDNDREYVLQAFQDVEMPDQSDEEEDDQDDQEDTKGSGP